jgi:LuxR family transcriptional regulator, maltose regulon positive regulatory protein
MTDNAVDERPRQRRAAGGPVFDLLASKLRRPAPRPGAVGRTALIERLERAESQSIVSVVAPAGYGKTTLLAQWAERDGKAVAWVSVDENDNDPKVLLTYIARALDAVQPLGELVFDALASPVSSVPGSVVPRLGNAFSSMTVPVTLILDDVHLVRNTECRAALSVLADHVPAGSRLVLAGRDAPPVRTARLRAQGRITEIGPADLSLTRAEAVSLLRAAEVALGEQDAAELHRRTEGWAAGLYLAALYLREGGSLAGSAVSFNGADRLVSQYMEAEFLERIPARQLTFLTRSAVLERMSGPLCQAVLGLPGAAALLADLARSNMLLVPLDRSGRWYRYHHLFRDMLLAELQRREPELIPALRRRAATWCLSNDQAEEALGYSIAAHDVDTVGRLVEQLWLPMYWDGRRGTLERWLRWLDQQGGIREHPMIAVMAGFLYTVTGRPVEAERWAALIDRWQYHDPGWAGDPATEAFAATLRAVQCQHGIEQMRADLHEAARSYAAAGIVTPTPALYLGIACVLSGDPGDSAAFFQDAVTLAEQTDAQEMLVGALWELSLLAMARGDWTQAQALADRTRAAARRPGAEELLVWAAQARIAAHRADIPAARQALAHAQRLRPLLTYAMSPIAVQVRLELVHTHLALADLAGARTVMREIDELLRHRPLLGTLVSQAQELRARLAGQHGPGVPGASALTAAELRVLPLLATHLSYPEIAAELFVSPNTIKSQAYSLFRKLGATSRSQAVTRSRELSLLEG